MSATATEVISKPEAGIEVEPEFQPLVMTADRYERLVEAGVYDANDPVFLWHGRLVEKTSKGRPHSFTSMSLYQCLVVLMPVSWHTVLETPLRLSGDNVPEPDLMVVRGSLRDYLQRSRQPQDVGNVIEVADSGVAQDSVTKLKAYAANGILVYWIVDLQKGKIDVYTGPSGLVEKPSYQVHREYGPNDEIPVVLDGVEVGRIGAKEILP